jgi:hypothetical protein
VLACNGEQFAIAPSDSEANVLYAKAVDLRPGSEILDVFKTTINGEDYEKRAQELNVAFQSRRFTRVSSLFTSAQVNEQLGLNPFVRELFPIITRYFGHEADEAPDEIIERGYVDCASTTAATP